MVDNSLPQAYKYPLVKTKKEMLIEGKSPHFNFLTYKSILAERCTEIERANRILLERMTSILAGPATHHVIHNHHANYSKSQTTKNHPHSSKKRGNTALPSDSGARAMLMHGVQHPLSQSNQIITSMTAGRPQGHEVSSPLMNNAPLMNMTENEGPGGSLVADSNINAHLNVESAASQLQMNAHSNQSLHLVQTKQDHDKRSTDPFFET